MPKFRKKPVVIEAWQFDGSWESARPIIAWINDKHTSWRYFYHDGSMIIRTLEGDMVASPGDWIIRGVKGEFYPCKPDIFAATYEPVEG